MMILRRIFTNSVYISAYYVFQKISLFVFYIILARILGNESVGQFNFAMSYVFLFSIVADAGLGTLLTKDIARSPEKAQYYLNNILTLKFILSIFCFLLLAIVAFFLHLGPTKTKLVYVFAIVNLLSINTTTFYSLFRAYKNIKYEAVISFIRDILSYIPGGILMLLGADIVTMTYPFIVAYFLTFCLCAYIVYKRFVPFYPSFDFSLSKKMLLEAYPYAINSIAIAFLIRIDIIMLSFMKGDAVAGWYSIAHSLVYGLLAIPFVYSLVMFPEISHFHENKHNLKRVFEFSTKIFLTIGMAIGIIGCVFAEKIILILYGPNFLNSVVILQYLIWVSILLFIRYIYINILGAIDQQKLVSNILMGLAIINIVINILLIPSYSYMGAIWATFLSEIVGIVLGFMAIYKHIPDIRVSPACIKITLAGLLLIMTIQFLMKIGINLNMIIAAILYTGIYAAYVFILRVFSHDDMGLLIKSILKKENSSS